MKQNISRRARVNLIFLGLTLVNLSANYLAGSVSIYGAAAFRSFGNVEMFSMMLVVELTARSATLLFSGNLGETFGRKPLYLFSVSGYILSMIGCALAPTGGLLLLARGISGFFWGLFFANVFTMLDDVMEKEVYSIRVGLLQTLTTLDFLVGPVLCGLLIDAFSWRAAIWGGIPFLLAGLAITFVFMPSRKELFGWAIREEKWEPCSADAVSSETAPANIGIKGLLSQPMYAVMLLITFLVYCSTATGNYIPLYAQTVLHTSTSVSALALAPCNFIGMLVASYCGIYISKKGCSRPLVFVMTGACALGSCMFLGTFFLNSYLPILLVTSCLGFCNGIAQVLPFAFVQRNVARPYVATGISFISFIQGLSGVISCAIYGKVLTVSLQLSLCTAIIYSVLVFFFALLRYRSPEKQMQ